MIRCELTISLVASGELRLPPPSAYLPDVSLLHTRSNDAKTCPERAHLFVRFFMQF